MDRRWKFASLVFIGVGLLFVVVQRERLVDQTSPPTISSPILDAIGQPTVVATNDTGVFSDVSSTVGIVVPHHLVAAPLIRRTVQAVAGSNQPRTIVIIGPDHQKLNPSRHIVSVSAWRWAGRTIPTNPEVIEALGQLPSVSRSDALIVNEHSVLTPLPFLATQFPQSLIILLTVRGGIDSEADSKIIDTLDRVLEPDDLLVASVDFSHYQNLQTAQGEDARSLVALEVGDLEGYSDLPVDSPASLAMLTQFAQRRNAQFRVFEQSNSALILGAPGLDSTTGYITGAWIRQ